MSESGKRSGAIDGEKLEQFRGYLKVLAEANVAPALRGKIDASDAVQQTLLAAYQARHQFRGESDEELAGWLKRILLNTLLRTLRDFKRAKRDVRLERPLQQAVDQSSACLEQWLSGGGTSPSRHVMRAEEAVRLTEALDTLPEEQRRAIVMYYWQGCTLAQVAEVMGKTTSSVAGLVYRGLAKLRKQMEETS
ncbi:MAG: sigma-70 family RNA polymerase sigma factor [Planctomycetota bacterium]|nr:MAG: sigma-70 family RNA polymerase sigma factor [Planctomycetota bacterium]